MGSEFPMNFLCYDVEDHATSAALPSKHMDTSMQYFYVRSSKYQTKALVLSSYFPLCVLLFFLSLILIHNEKHKSEEFTEGLTIEILDMKTLPL